MKYERIIKERMLAPVKIGISVFIVVVSLLLISAMQDVINKKEVTGSFVSIFTPLAAYVGLVVGIGIFLWMIFYPAEKKSESGRLLKKV